MSADKVDAGSEQIPNVDVLYTEDILNAIIPPNYPDHPVVLKVGMPVILIRNLNQGMGLCNGTRLLITRLADCVLVVTVMTGLAIAQLVCIPRIVLSVNDRKWPFVLQRRQFPFEYAMHLLLTIDKSQGPTLKKVGIIYLQNPVFYTWSTLWGCFFELPLLRALRFL